VVFLSREVADSFVEVRNLEPMVALHTEDGKVSRFRACFNPAHLARQIVD
jgi:hypothetical protein